MLEVALAAYARQAKDKELVLWAGEIKVRAERRAGEMLATAKVRGERNVGHRPSKASHDATLSGIGISRDQSSRWQQLADVLEHSMISELCHRQSKLSDGFVKPHETTKRK